jgi:hypothetical protein
MGYLLIQSSSRLSDAQADLRTCDKFSRFRTIFHRLLPREIIQLHQSWLKIRSLQYGTEQHFVKLIAGCRVEMLEAGLVPVCQNLLLVGLHHLSQF